MKSRILRRMTPWLCCALVLAAGEAVGADRPRLLPADCELDIALSAAPEHLRAGADVFVLGEQGYEKVRSGDNGFSCIINRDHPMSLKPTCFDAEGSATIVPKILRFGERMMAGRALDEIRAEIEVDFAEGRLISPRRPGVAYMLSAYNRPYNGGTGKMGRFPPHVMFYAPGLTNADIGFSRDAFRENRSLPFIAYQGPHGYMITIVQGAGGASPATPTSCPAWIDE